MIRARAQLCLSLWLKQCRSIHASERVDHQAAAFLKVDASTLTNLEIDWEKISAAVVDYLKRDSGKLSTPRLVLSTFYFQRDF